WGSSGRNRRAYRLMKLAGAITEQNGDVTGVIIYNREIGVAVFIEVGCRHGKGTSPRGNGRATRLTEAAMAVSEEDRHVIRPRIRDREIKLAVPVELPDRDGE